MSMRLKPEKIEQLGELIYETLLANSEVKVNGERRDVIHEITKVITEDFQAEAEIEAEAQAILEQHEDDMRRMGVNHAQMLRKTMRKIARDKGMVL